MKTASPKLDGPVMRAARCCIVLLLILTNACRGTGYDRPAQARPCAHIGSLAATLEPLERWFDEGLGNTRFLALLSPT